MIAFDFYTKKKGKKHKIERKFTFFGLLKLELSSVENVKHLYVYSIYLVRTIILQCCPLIPRTHSLAAVAAFVTGNFLSHD